MIYIFIFVLSFAFCACGEHISLRGKNKEGRVFFLLAVLTVSYLAGARDLTVGTDIMTYSHWLFLGARDSEGIFSFIRGNPSIDILYSVLVYLVSKVFGNEHWLYFLSGLFTYGFTMAGLLKFKKYSSVSWAWFCYLALLYGDSLNVMRQSIAIAIVIWAFTFAMSQQYKKYIVWTVIACLFHITAIVSFGIFLIYWLMKKNNTVLMRLLIILGTITLLLFYSQLLNLFIGIGILGDKFSRYASGNFGLGSLNPIIVRMPFVLLILLFYRVFIGGKRSEIIAYYGGQMDLQSKKNADFLIMMMLIEMMAAQMRVVNVSLYRLALYFCMFRCISIGRIINALKRGNKLIISVVVFLLLVLVFVYQNIVQGNNAIYPYVYAGFV